MNGCINVAEAPEFMVSRRPPNTLEKARSGSISRPNSPLENTPHKARVKGDDAIPAAGALIDVAAKRRGAARDDGGHDLQVQPGEPLPAALVKGGSGCADQVGHLQRWPRHLLGVGGAGVDRQGIERTERSREMAPGEMDVDHRLPQIGVAEEQLYGAQVGAGFEQMRGEAMPQRMRMQRLADACALGGFAASVPDNFVADGGIGGVPAAAREQPHGRLAGQPAIMGAQFVEQMGTEHDVAILAALPFLDMESHARRVDIGEFQGRALGAAHAGAIERHENGAVERYRRGVDQARDLFRTPDDRQVNALFRIRSIAGGPRALQHLHEKETQSSNPLVHCVVGEFSVTKEVGRVLANVFRGELIGWTVEIARQVLDDSQVRARGRFSVITTLEFLQHHFSKMGHRDLLVTQTYRRTVPKARPYDHAKRLP